MLRNKKGHLPTIFLFVIAITLIFFSLFIIFSFKNNVEDEGKLVIKLIQNLEYDEKYVPEIFERMVSESLERADKSNFRTSFESNLIEISESINSFSTVSGNFFEKIEQGDYDLVPKFENNEVIYTLNIKDIKVESTIQNHKIERTFDLSIIFGKDGVISQDL